jgi:hypothetical protein
MVIYFFLMLSNLRPLHPLPTFAKSHKLLFQSAGSDISTYKWNGSGKTQNNKREQYHTLDNKNNEMEAMQAVLNSYRMILLRVDKHFYLNNIIRERRIVMQPESIQTDLKITIYS